MFPRASITVHQVSGQGGDALLEFHTVFSYKRALQLKHPSIQFSAKVPRAVSPRDAHCFVNSSRKDGALGFAQHNQSQFPRRFSAEREAHLHTPPCPRTAFIAICQTCCAISRANCSRSVSV